MISELCLEAVKEARVVGCALLKFITANNVGSTGSHECGYLIPKPVWRFFTPNPPTDGVNSKSHVKIRWQGDQETDSVITWYGNKTRSEYRLTRFGRGFPYLKDEYIGSLLVLIPMSHERFAAYVLDSDEDIAEIQTTLGVEIVTSYAFYGESGEDDHESERACIDSRFSDLLREVSDFPTGDKLSEFTAETMRSCVQAFADQSADRQLVQLVEEEYTLFRTIESELCRHQIFREFQDVDDFLATANTILNRRKARAGRSLENHVRYLLQSASIKFSYQPRIDGRPDFVFPSEEAYRDDHYPSDRLLVLGVKTTCKDRWRQVLNEGRRVRVKHLLTIQQGISSNQLEEMKAGNLVLVVPDVIHKSYPKEYRSNLLSVHGFISEVSSRLA